MAKGIPAKGFRVYKSGKVAYIGQNKNDNNVAHSANNVVEIRPNIIKHEEPMIIETDDQIKERITERFSIIKNLTEGCVMGDVRALIVSGKAGLGKSYTIEETLREWDIDGYHHTIIKGYVRATGLVKTLYDYREKGNVVVFDDADSIFFDETSLNLLKAVCDTTERRTVNWLSERILVSEENAVPIPKKFDFEGTIIFVTNYDFLGMIEKNHKLAPHLEALVSRALYIDCGLKTQRDCVIRIRQMVENHILNDLTVERKKEILDFIDTEKNNLRELTLRMAVKLGSLVKTYGNNWEKYARITCCK